MRTHSAAHRAAAIAPALAVIGLTGLLAAGPASAATNVADGIVSLDQSCPTDYADTSVPLCSYVKISTSDFLLAGVPDAIHEAVTVTLQKDGVDVATGHPNVKYARGGGELFFVGVRPGTYTAIVTAPDGYKQAGDVNVAPDVTVSTTLAMQPVQGVLNSRTIPVKLTDADVPLAPVDVYVWDDANANGRLDGNEGSPDSPVSLELKNHEASNDGYVAQNSYGSGMDTGVRTYWYVPGTYTATMNTHGSDLVPLAVIDPTSLTGEVSIPAEGTSLMIPVGPRGTVINPGNPTDPTTPTDPVDVAPVVTATTHPKSSTTDTTAAFAFTADQDGVTWTRAVDGGDAEASAAAFELTDLAVGEHQVVVTATSAAGLTSAPVTITWTVTAPAPVVPSVEQGATFDVAGDGFTAGEDVEVWIHSDPILITTLNADADGSVSSTITIPAEIAAGAHRIELRGLTSGVSVWQDITVTAAPAAVTPAAPIAADAPAAAPAAAATPDGSLAVTGSNGWAVGGLAALLISTGAAAMIFRWRKTLASNMAEMTEGAAA